MVNSYNNPNLGSFHGSELAALFAGPTPAREDDRELFLAMREYWTSFVASGRPSTTASSWSVRVHLSNCAVLLTANWHSFSPGFFWRLLWGYVIMIQRVANTDGNLRILLQPASVKMENMTEALVARCAFWHGLSGELNG